MSLTGKVISHNLTVTQTRHISQWREHFPFKIVILEYITLEKHILEKHIQPTSSITPLLTTDAVQEFNWFNIMSHDHLE